MTDYEKGAFRITEESGYCAFPVGGDTYRDCAHGCLYCYEKQCDNQHLRKTDGPSPRDPRALFKSLFGDPECEHFAIKHRIPVQLGVVSDPFPPQEAKVRNTLRTLSLLSRSGIGVLLTTKAPNRITERIDSMMSSTLTSTRQQCLKAHRSRRQ